jgi:hypothetical protein
VELVDPVSRVRDEELAHGAEREPSKLTASPVRWPGRSPDEVRDRHHSISVRPARTSPQLGACHPHTGSGRSRRHAVATPTGWRTSRRAVVPGGAFAASATQSREARILGIRFPQLARVENEGSLPRGEAVSRAPSESRRLRVLLLEDREGCPCGAARLLDRTTPRRLASDIGRPATVTRSARRCWHLPCCRCGPSSSKQRASDLARQVEALARW